MKNRLILVEGIPGSGKTIISKKIRDYLMNKGIDVILYNEGDMHPADMAWNALLTRDEYNNAINENIKYENIIKENTIFEDEYVIVAYTKLGFHKNENKLMNFLEAHEIYDGRVSIEIFKDIHLKRWTKFRELIKEDKNKIVIFECAFLQNHVNELLAMHEKDLDYIRKYLNELIETVRELNPKLIYLKQLSVKETLTRVSRERVSDNKEIYPDWIDMVTQYFENSKYGKHNNINGFDGLVRYLKQRQVIELKVIKSLPIDNIIINNKNYDYEAMLSTILNNLNI